MRVFYVLKKEKKDFSLEETNNYEDYFQQLGVISSSSWEEVTVAVFFSLFLSFLISSFSFLPSLLFLIVIPFYYFSFLIHILLTLFLSLFFSLFILSSQAGSVHNIFQKKEKEKEKGGNEEKRTTFRVTAFRNGFVIVVFLSLHCCFFFFLSLFLFHKINKIK